MYTLLSNNATSTSVLFHPKKNEGLSASAFLIVYAAGPRKRCRVGISFRAFFNFILEVGTVLNMAILNGGPHLSYSARIPENLVEVNTSAT